MLPKFSQIVNRLYAFIYETNHSKSGLGLPSRVALVIVIDKSCTRLGRHEKTFYTGLKKFIKDCKPLLDSTGNRKCPCKSCRLVLWVSIKNLSRHITNYGFDPSYKTWIHHGELDLPPPLPVIDNTRQPQMCDMTAYLNDLCYIPLNNEQNKPTQGDICETSNEPTQAKLNEFEELYASANEELYPGCDYVTRLDFMTKFTYFKVKGKLIDSIFNKMLEFFQNVFPTSKGFKLPPSYYPIKKTFKMTGLGHELINACVNDCFLFWGYDNKDVHFCPVCNMSRWKDSNTSRKKVPKKCTEPGKMQYSVDGRAWKNFDIKYPDFLKEPRNVRLGLAADGFNPFDNPSQAYSMWPVILTTYNLPPWLCMKESSFMLTLLITGLKSSGKDIDTINDFLARSSSSGWSGQGYKACTTCNKDTPSMPVLGKTTYVGHRRFLKKPHKWWRLLEFNGETKDGDPPREFDRDQIQAQLARLPTRMKGKHPSYGGVKIKRNVLVELNWTKRSIFYELEYWSFLTLKHNLDVMHIEKNVLESFLNTLLMNDKSKDTTKARQDLKNLGIRSDLWLGQNKNEKCSKPQAKYSFTPENRKKFCQFIKGVKLPDGFGSNFKHKVTDNDSNITGLKSHDCHIMMQHLLPYGLQQYLLDTVAKPIIELCSFFKQICSAARCPGIDTYRSQFKSKFPNKDMKEEFPNWFGPRTRQRHVDKDPGVSASNELFALAFGPTPTPILVNSCVVNGVRFVVHSRDECRTTQNSGICSPGRKYEEMYYGQLQEILDFSYLLFKAKGKSFKDDQYILATQVKQVFYLEDMARRRPNWKVVEHVNHKKFLNGGVIVVEANHDVIHFDNSSDLALSTSLNDLDFETLHIDGQSTNVEAPPDIINIDEDDDIIDDEDVLPYDLADSDDEVLVNVDDDDVAMSVDVAQGHDSDGSSDYHPPSYQVPTSYEGCLGNRGKGIRKPNLGGRKVSKLHTRQETQNLGLKKIIDVHGPIPILFEWNDRETLMPLSNHAAHLANYLKELVRELPMYYPSWRQVPAEWKARVLAKIGTQFDLKPHMESERWPKIYTGIQQHLQKIYNGNKSALKAHHWV
ncbi:reverse transcriptase domain-containing protein [Tanacetum coccineum]